MAKDKHITAKPPTRAQAQRYIEAGAIIEALLNAAVKIRFKDSELVALALDEFAKHDMHSDVKRRRWRAVIDAFQALDEDEGVEEEYRYTCEYSDGYPHPGKRHEALAGRRFSSYESAVSYAKGVASGRNAKVFRCVWRKDEKRALPECPTCEVSDTYISSKGGYKCNGCGEPLSVGGSDGAS